MTPQQEAAFAAALASATNGLVKIIAEYMADHLIDAKVFDKEVIPRKLYNLSEACFALNITPPTLRKLMRKGLPTIQILSATKIELDAAVAWLRQQGTDE